MLKLQQFKSILCTQHNVKTVLCSHLSRQHLAWTVHLGCRWMPVMWGQGGSCFRLMSMGWLACEFLFKKCNPSQLNYSVIEKETLTLVWALLHFEVYIDYSGPLVIYTDHNPFTFLHSLYYLNHRLMHWILFLQSFCLEIRHINGPDNLIADALSRAPCSRVPQCAFIYL